MEYLLEVRWDDPIAVAVGRILSSAPKGVEQTTGNVPQSQGRAFVVYRSDSFETLEGLAHHLGPRRADPGYICHGLQQKLMKEVRHMAKDPVCGMEVDEKKAAGTSTHHGKTHFFCAPSCKTTFVKAPEKYVTSEKGRKKGCA